MKMRKNNLTVNKGLSLSQAQSISNLCNQRCIEINNQINKINNYSKTVKVNNEDFIIQNRCEIPVDIIDLIKEKARLHATQAFLMENIKAKDLMLKQIKSETANIDEVKSPNLPKFVDPHEKQKELVDENYGWSQLTKDEINEYLEAEAYASHIGNFIHENRKLDLLRKELSNVPEIEWMEVEAGKKTPVKVIKHHSPQHLLRIHEDLAALHRQYEQKVNYYLAKVKNLTTIENSNIAKHNSDITNNANNINSGLSSAYENELRIYREKVKQIQDAFEITRQERIKEITSMRIEVDKRFQDVVDMFLNKVDEE